MYEDIIRHLMTLWLSSQLLLYLSQLRLQPFISSGLIINQHLLTASRFFFKPITAHHTTFTQSQISKRRLAFKELCVLHFAVVVVLFFLFLLRLLIQRRQL